MAQKDTHVTSRRGMARKEVFQPMEDFKDPKQEWRRLFSGALGTFFLVLAPPEGDDGSSLPRHHQSHGRGRRVGLMAGWRSSCSWARFPAPTSTRRSASPSPFVGDFPMAKGPRVHRRAARGRTGRLVPPVRDPRRGDVRLQLPRGRLFLVRRVPDGVGAHGSAWSA